LRLGGNFEGGNKQNDKASTPITSHAMAMSYLHAPLQLEVHYTVDEEIAQAFWIVRIILDVTYSHHGVIVAQTNQTNVQKGNNIASIVIPKIDIKQYASTTNIYSIAVLELSLKTTTAEMSNDNNSQYQEVLKV